MRIILCIHFLILSILTVKGQYGVARGSSHIVSKIEPYNSKTAFTVNSYIRDYSELPIKPVKTIKFISDESCNLHVDISPNGKELLFTILGELFLMPVEGGDAVQITRGISVNSKPIWSPNGNYIAFISDATGRPQTHIRSLKGDYHIILNDEDPARFSRVDYTWDEDWAPVWLPEGNALLSDTSLFSITGELKAITKFPFRKDLFKKGMTTTFSSDGNFIFTSDFTNYQNWQVYKIKRATYDTTQVFAGGFNSKPRDIKISPDGKWICYLRDSYKDSGGGMYCFNLKDKAEHLLIKFSDYNDRYNGINRSDESPIQHYCFSQDGNCLYIGYGGKIHKINLESRIDKVIPFRAKMFVDVGPRTMHKFRISYEQQNIRNTANANCSNDGRRLVFNALKKIYLMDLPNGNARELATGPGALYKPCFSPDNKQVSYLCHVDSLDEGRIYIISSKVSEPPKLITSMKGVWRYVCWSPDGLSLAGLFRSSFGNRMIDHLLIISLTSGQVTELKTDSSYLMNGPISFSLDGNSICYTYDLNKYANISKPRLKVLFAVNKNDMHEEAKIATNFTGADFLSASPDGRFFIFSYNEDLFMVPMEDTGKTINLIGVKRVKAIRFAIGGTNPHWEQNGKVLSWSWGNKYFYSTPERILEANKHSVSFVDSADALPFLIQDIALHPGIVDIRLPQQPFFCKGSIVLRGAKIITMDGNNIIKEGTIVVYNGRITQVGELGTVKIPLGAKIIDVKGATIMPGMIDLHEHVARREITFEEEYNSKTYFAYGVTTAIDPSSSMDMFGYQEIVQAGFAKGPKYYSVGKSIGPVYRAALASQADAINQVRKRVELGAIAIKQYKQKTRIQQQWLLVACNRFGVNMTNETASNMEEFVGHIKNGTPKIEHVFVYGGADFKDYYNLVGAAGVYITSTNLINTLGEKYFRNQYPDKTSKYKRLNPEAYGQSFDDTAGFYSLSKTNHLLDQDVFTANMIKSGCKVPLGSHGDIPGIGMHYELWNTTLGGLSNWDALRAATLWGAEGLGLDKYLGSIKVGKIADLIVLDKNPLKDIHNTKGIRFIMKDGVLYDGNTLDIIWKGEETRLKCTSRRE